MTLFIPDISHHQRGINIQSLKDEGCAALIARVGQGAGRNPKGKNYGTTRDTEWVRHRDEAHRVGLPLLPYWYVGDLITPGENARLAKDWSGGMRYWMIDQEYGSGNIAFYREVIAAFDRAGMTVVLGYLPRWYYDAVGGGPLSPGPLLVNSRYPSAQGGTPQDIYARIKGDESGAWQGYGGQQVALWQFTNEASLASMAIDCSAFRGTREELMTLIEGADMPLTDKDVEKIADRIFGAILQGQGLPADNNRRTTRQLLEAISGYGERVVHVENQIAELQRAITALTGVTGADPVALAQAVADEFDRRARDNNTNTGPAS
jgi:hypothetical protein